MHRGRPGPACLSQDTAPGPCESDGRSQQRPCSGWLLGWEGGSCCFARDPSQAALLTGGDGPHETCRPLRPRSPESSLHTSSLSGPLFPQQPGQGDTSGAGPRAGSLEISDSRFIVTSRGLSPWPQVPRQPAENTPTSPQGKNPQGLQTPPAWVTHSRSLRE